MARPRRLSRGERTARRAERRERRKRFGLLLAAVVAAFIVQGIATPGRWEQVVVAVLLAATLMLSLWVAEARVSVVIGFGVIAGLLVFFSLFEAIRGDVYGLAVKMADLLLVVLAPPAIGVGLVRGLRKSGQVTVDALFGVLSIYLLLGMFFAAAYGVVAKLQGAFFAQNASDSIAHFIYFSFTTLTTVGYGDFTASTNLGHTLSVLEGLVGQIYLVTVVSVIVANLRPRRDAAAATLAEADLDSDTGAETAAPAGTVPQT